LPNVYDLSKEEKRRLRAALEGVAVAELVDEDLDEPALTAALVEVLTTVNVFAAEMATAR
jgi:hypothetical protein